MKNNTDEKITKTLFKIVNILFLYNIDGTCYGCLCGIILLSLQDMIAIVFPPVSLIKWYGFISFGIIIFNIKPFIKKKYENPKIETVMNYTREIIKEGEFSAKEKREIWKNVVNSIIDKYMENIKTDIQEYENDNNVID